MRFISAVLIFTLFFCPLAYSETASLDALLESAESYLSDGDTRRALMACDLAEKQTLPAPRLTFCVRRFI